MSPPVTEYTLVFRPVWSCKERETENAAYSPKHSHIAPHSYNTCTAGFNRRSFAEVYAETNAECQHIPALCLWTNWHYRRGSVQLGQIYKLNDYTTEKDQPYTITQDFCCCQQNKSLNINKKALICDTSSPYWSSLYRYLQTGTALE